MPTTRSTPSEFTYTTRGARESPATRHSRRDPTRTPGSDNPTMHLRSAAVAVTVLPPQIVLAWGGQGHQVIAIVARGSSVCTCFQCGVSYRRFKMETATAVNE